MKLFFLMVCLSAQLRAQSVASWEQFSDSGKLAANGRPFNPKAFCCACRTFPIGTKLRITEIHNKLSVVVTVSDKINLRYSDRIDLSPLAYSQLNGLETGLSDVRVEVVK